jgi:hypothetical protein
VITANADGSGATAVGEGEDPTWSPDGRYLAWVGHCGGQGPDKCLVDLQPGGSTGYLENNVGYDDTAPSWGTFDPHTEPPYIRPRGATLLRVPMVPAFDECVDGNTLHGAPLAFGSCAPPVQSSSKLTFGTPDANGKPVNGFGSFELKAVVDNPNTTADEADIRIAASLTDVRCLGAGSGCGGGTLTDYSGDLLAQMYVSITDNDRIPQRNYEGLDSTSNGYVSVSMPCTATIAPDRGSSCSISTSVDALFAAPPPPAPEAIIAGRRSIWAPHDIAIMDNSDFEGGKPLAVPGLFVP